MRENHTLKELKKICISTVAEIAVVSIGDIIHCESSKNYTTVHLNDKTKLVASKTLGDFEAMLNEHNFCRVHQSHLVNMAFVKSFKKNNGGAIIMLDGTQIIVSTRKKEEFLRRLKEMSCAIL